MIDNMSKVIVANAKNQSIAFAAAVLSLHKKLPLL